MPKYAILLIDGTQSWANIIENATGIKTVICSTQFLLNNVCEPNPISIVIPKSDGAALFVSEYKQEILQNGYKFLTSNVDIVKNLSDKQKLASNSLYKYLPRTYTYNNIIYPFMLKHRHGEWGTSVYLINNKHELDKKLLSINNLDNYIFQEAIVSQYEYSTQFLVINGKIKLMYTKLNEAMDELFVRGKHYNKLKVTTIDSRVFDKTIFEKFF